MQPPGKRNTAAGPIGSDNQGERTADARCDAAYHRGEQLWTHRRTKTAGVKSRGANEPQHSVGCAAIALLRLEDS